MTDKNTTFFTAEMRVSGGGETMSGATKKDTLRMWGETADEVTKATLDGMVYEQCFRPRVEIMTSLPTSWQQIYKGLPNDYRKMRKV